MIWSSEVGAYVTGKKAAEEVVEARTVVEYEGIECIVEETV